MVDASGAGVFDTHPQHSVNLAVDAQKKCRIPIDHRPVRGERDARLANTASDETDHLLCAGDRSQRSLPDTTPIGGQDDV